MERNNWNMLNGTKWFANYTLNNDATLMYLIRGECDCESNDCYSESETECKNLEVNGLLKMIH